MRLLAFFSGVATLILATAGPSLIWPGTPLDAIWLLNPPRLAELMPYRAFIGPIFIALVVPAALACVGFLLRRRWGWWLGVGALVANGIGDLAQIAMGRVFEGLFGVSIAALLLVYLTRPRVHASFS